MDAIFITSRNSKTPAPHRLSLNLSHKINLKRKNEYVAISNLSVYYISKNAKISSKNNKLKIPAPRWNAEFELPDRSYSVSDIQD